jgi:hypothetical protein
MPLLILHKFGEPELKQVYTDWRFMERETEIEPATSSLGSGVGFILSGTYLAFFEIRKPIEPAI